MKRKALVLLVCLFGWLGAQSQKTGENSIAIENSNGEVVMNLKNNHGSVVVKSPENLDSLEFWLEDLLSGLENLDFIAETDTPRQDTSKVIIHSYETDSGVIMTITVTNDSGSQVQAYNLRNKKERIQFKKRMREIFRESDGEDLEEKIEFYSFKKDKSKENDRVTEDWFNLDIGFNGLLYNGSPSFPSSLSNLELDPWKSLHVNVGIFQQKVRLYKKNVSLFYGINYDNNDYRFSRNIDFRVNNDKISYEADSVTPGFVRNKLTTRFVTIPLGFNFVINPSAKRSFHIAVGMHAGYRLTSFFKKVYNDEGKRKRKIHDDYELNNFRYGAFVKVGYGSFTLFGNYVMTPLFRENAGPEFNTFSFGLTIGDFLSN